MKLLIRNLDRDISEPTLRDLFEAHGKVQSCDLVMDTITQGSKGFGFVEMPNSDEAETAIEALNASEQGSKRIRVKMAEEPEPKEPYKGAPEDKDAPEESAAEKLTRSEQIWGNRKKKS